MLDPNFTDQELSDMRRFIWHLADKTTVRTIVKIYGKGTRKRVKKACAYAGYPVPSRMVAAQQNEIMELRFRSQSVLEDALAELGLDLRHVPEQKVNWEGILRGERLDKQRAECGAR